MMTIKDTRAKNNKVDFEDLPIGQVYEDTEGIVCIKTWYGDTEDNCICYIDGKWESSLEGFTSKVIPLKTTLLIER